MQKAGSPLGKWRIVVPFLVAVLVAVADQLTKTWVRSYPEGSLIHRIGFLQLIHVDNTGAAFGIFQGQSFALTIVALFGIAVFLLLSLFLHRLFPLLAGTPSRIALGLILGGSVGNLVDRIRLGYVTDFIDFRVWPAFNVADSCIVVGSIILAYFLIRFALTEKH